MTLEEPIEYRLPFVRQTDVQEKLGLGFAEGISSILRQDPDVILIGEVRDPSAAQMAFRATMTGHQVFTTLHTHDALGAFYRLLDLGVPPALLAGNLSAIVAQRLVRHLCVWCKKKRFPTAQERAFLKIPPREKIYAPQACKKCRFTGYAGRSAIGEIFTIDDEVNDLISQGATRKTLKEYMQKKQFVSLAENGKEKILSGHTSFGELQRVLGAELFQ